MNIRKVKRKCGVRGCKNIECFAVSKTNEVGNSVILCKDCLKEASSDVENYNSDEKRKKYDSAPPPIFFNNLSETEKVTVYDVEHNSKQATENEDQPFEVEHSTGNDEQLPMADRVTEKVELISEEYEQEPFTEDKEIYICQNCGRELKSKAGYTRHIASCHSDIKEE